MNGPDAKSAKRMTIVALGLIIGLSGCVTVDEVFNNKPDPLVEKAESGDAAAQYRLGLRYTNGSGVKQNYQTATAWFNKAAANNHAAAQYMAAINYSTGRGAAQDHEKAATLYAKAADQGHARAQYQLATVYANGRGVAKDLDWAVRYFEKAARRGHSKAMLSYGVLRGVGSGVQKDVEDAWVWLSLAEREKEPDADKLRARIEEKMSAAQLQAARHNLENWAAIKQAEFADVPTVRYVQRQLNALGIQVGSEDGVLGPRTNEGIASYRKAKGLGQSAEPINQDLLDSLKKTTAGKTS